MRSVVHKPSRAIQLGCWFCFYSGVRYTYTKIHHYAYTISVKLKTKMKTPTDFSLKEQAVRIFFVVAFFLKEKTQDLESLVHLLFLFSWHPLASRSFAPQDIYLVVKVTRWRRKFSFRKRSMSFLRTVVAILNGRYHFSERLLPFKTVDAISQNGRCHLKQSMPFLRTVIAI